jgi:nodal
VFLTFNLSRISRHEITKKAELRLRVDGNSNRNQKYRTKVRIFREGVRIADMKYTVRSQREASTGTDIVDLTPVLQTIIDGGYGDTLIEVKLRKKNKQGQRQRRTTDDTHPSVVKNAILVIFTRDKNFFKKIKDNRVGALLHTTERADAADDVTTNSRHGRSRDKRASERRAQLGARKLCQRHDFDIDFADIGWDKWIIYPKRYNAYYCMGRCPTPVEKSYSPTNHAILQGLIRLGNTIIPRPCCVPTKLRPLSMLYYEYDEIVVRQHEDMIATECGCR